jgi:hypothetical protein
MRSNLLDRAEQEMANMRNLVTALEIAVDGCSPKEVRRIEVDILKKATEIALNLLLPSCIAIGKAKGPEGVEEFMRRITDSLMLDAAERILADSAPPELQGLVKEVIDELSAIGKESRAE